MEIAEHLLLFLCESIIIGHSLVDSRRKLQLLRILSLRLSHLQRRTKQRFHSFRSKQRALQLLRHFVDSVVMQTVLLWILLWRLLHIHLSDMVLYARMPLLKKLLFNDWVSAVFWHGEAFDCVHADLFWNWELMLGRIHSLRRLWKNYVGHLSSFWVFLNNIQWEVLVQFGILGDILMFQFILLTIERIAGSYDSHLSKISKLAIWIRMFLEFPLIVQIIDANVCDFILSKLCWAINISKGLIWCVVLLRVLQFDTWTIYLLVIYFQANVIFHEWSISLPGSWPCWS